MSQAIAVKLNKRETLGKGLKAMRREGQVPAVIHNHGGDSIPVVGDYRELQKVYNQAGTSQTVQVTVDGKGFLTIIRDVDLEPTKHTIRHIVFQALRQNEEIETEVPIVFAEVEIPAEKKSLLILRELETLAIKALPKDLPEKIEVNLSSLSESGDMVRVSEIKLPAGVTLVTNPDTPVAVVETPRDQVAEADASAASLAEDAEKPAEEPSTESSTETPEEKPAE